MIKLPFPKMISGWRSNSSGGAAECHGVAEHRIAAGDEARRAEEPAVATHKVIRALEGRNSKRNIIPAKELSNCCALPVRNLCVSSRSPGSRLFRLCAMRHGGKECAYPELSYVTPLTRRLLACGAGQSTLIPTLPWRSLVVSASAEQSPIRTTASLFCSLGGLSND